MTKTIKKTTQQHIKIQQKPSGGVLFSIVIRLVFALLFYNASSITGRHSGVSLPTSSFTLPPTTRSVFYCRRMCIYNKRKLTFHSRLSNIASASSQRYSRGRAGNLFPLSSFIPIVNKYCPCQCYGTVVDRPNYF